MKYFWRSDKRDPSPKAKPGVSSAVRDRPVREIPIAYRLAASFTALVVVGLGVLGVLVLTYQANLMRQQIDEYGNTIVRQFAHSVTEPVFIDDHFTLQVITSNLIADPQIVGAAVLDEGGKKLFAAGEVTDEVLERSIQGGLLDDSYRLEPSARQLGEVVAGVVSFVAPVSFQNVVAGHVLISLSIGTIQSSFEATARVLVLAAILMMLLGIAIAAWMSRRIARPVEDLVVATDRLGSGDFNINLDTARRDELGKLAAAFNRMARSLREKQQMEGVLSRFVADDVAKTMLSDLDKVTIGCERVDASVLFVDIVGFTELAESICPDELVRLLNEYFAYFTTCSRLFFGTVDKFIGDCAMITFGAPKPDVDHRFNAIACASVMLRLLEEVNRKRRERGEREVQVRIGVNSGAMMAGIVGDNQRMEYTVVGDTVNVASRLSRLAEPGGMVVGEAVLQDESLQGRVSFSEEDEVAIRGRKAMIKTYRVAAIAPQHKRTMDHMINDILANAPAAREPDTSTAATLVQQVN